MGIMTLHPRIIQNRGVMAMTAGTRHSIGTCMLAYPTWGLHDPLRRTVVWIDIDKSYRLARITRPMAVGANRSSGFCSCSGSRIVARLEVFYHLPPEWEPGAPSERDLVGGLGIVWLVTIRAGELIALVDVRQPYWIALNVMTSRRATGCGWRGV